MSLILVRAEGEEAAVTVLHDKFARAPSRVAKGSRELDSARDILGVERVGVLDEQVGVEELVGVFVGIGLGRVGEAEMDSVLVTRDDSVDRRVVPGADTVEAKLVLVYEGSRPFPW